MARSWAEACSRSPLSFSASKAARVSGSKLAALGSQGRATLCPAGGRRSGALHRSGQRRQTDGRRGAAAARSFTGHLGRLSAAGGEALSRNRVRVPASRRDPHRRQRESPGDRRPRSLGSRSPGGRGERRAHRRQTDGVRHGECRLHVPARSTWCSLALAGRIG